MRILCCCAQEYYDFPGTLGSDYVFFVQGFRALGHETHHFDYVKAAFDRPAMNEFFVSLVRRGGYDLVWICTESDQFMPEALAEARRHAPLLAWNADDDIRWNDYSSLWAPRYTHVVTTYREVFERNKAAHPNLLLSQWGCTGTHDGLDVPKTIPVSFVGQIYAQRAGQLRRLKKSAGLDVYGKGTLPTLASRAWNWAARKLGVPVSPGGRLLAGEAQVKDVWNRSRISFTPLDGYRGGGLQIKARVFDMGLSGSVMLCNRHDALREFYEPGVEYVEFDGMDDCVERVRYLLAHEPERARIAAAYRLRTLNEHLWRHRFEALFRQIGLPAGRRA